LSAIPVFRAPLILILFAAGHETTSNALTFTCELKPAAQSKIASEIKK
jgi:cytochrome P450